MDSQQIPLDSFAYESLLQACVDDRTLLEGKLVHAHIILIRLRSRDIFLHKKLVNMYAKCRSLLHARANKLSNNKTQAHKFSEKGSKTLNRLPKQSGTKT